MKKIKLFTEMLAITLGTALVGAAVYFFMIPSGLPLGSVSGLAMLIANVVPLSIATITMILNVVLLILGFLQLGNEFGVKTVYTSILLPAVIGLFERYAPMNGSIMGDPLTDLFCFVFFCAIGQTILFNLNASSGGIDIITKILNKFFRIDIGKASIFAGMVVAGSSIFFYDFKTAILASSAPIWPASSSTISSSALSSASVSASSPIMKTNSSGSSCTIWMPAVPSTRPTALTTTVPAARSSPFWTRASIRSCWIRSPSWTPQPLSPSCPSTKFIPPNTKRKRPIHRLWMGRRFY